MQYLTGTSVLGTATQSGLADTLLHLLVRGLDVTWLRDHPARLAAVDAGRRSTPRRAALLAPRPPGLDRARRRGATPGARWRRSPRSRRSPTRDRLGPMQGLKEAIDRTGYYPEVVADGVMRAVSGEDVVSFFVHHEPTFDRDEVRRHLTVVVLTPSRLILAHTDEHEGDDMLPEPYTSTSTEAIALSSVKSVVVTRMVTNPTGGPTPPAEAVLTIGWGGVARLDLEPATCGDPECDADHGYTGTFAADDFSIRVSAAADGPEAVPSLLAFADSLSARTTELSERFLEPAYGSRSLADVAAGRRARPRRSSAGSPGSASRHPRPATGAGVRRLPRRRLGLRPAGGARPCRAVPLLAADPDSTGTAGVPVDDRDQPDLARHRAHARRPRRRGLHLAGARAPTGCSTRCSGTRTSTRCSGSRTRPRFQTLAAAGVHVTTVNKREFRDSGLTVAAHRGGEWVDADRVGERVAGAVAAASDDPVVHLPLRRRPGLDRASLRRRLRAVAPAARDDRRRGRAAPRRDARVTRAWSWSPTTAWSTPRSTIGSTSTTTRRTARAWCSSGARHASGTSTAPVERCPTSRPGGPSCSATGPRC